MFKFFKSLIECKLNPVYTNSDGGDLFPAGTVGDKDASR